ncbi:MAG: hypothetical protein ABL993_12565 [Vicinamibacterales bacterium]
MASAASVDRFGPFELDSSHRRLVRDGQLLPVRERQMDVLIVLVKYAGKTVTKDAITEDTPPASTILSICQAPARIRDGSRRGGCLPARRTARRDCVELVTHGREVLQGLRGFFS